MAKAKHIKISELPQTTFLGVDISDIGVFERNSQTHKLSSVFEFIKKSAMEDEGLTVELVDGNIIFIKGKKDYK
jgi:hypothetical protein